MCAKKEGSPWMMKAFDRSNVGSILSCPSPGNTRQEWSQFLIRATLQQANFMLHMFRS